MIQIVDLLFQVYTILLFARILGSWIPEWRDHSAMRFVSFYTDPYLNIFKKVIPPLGMMDISPIFAFLALSMMKYFFLGLAAKF